MRTLSVGSTGTLRLEFEKNAKNSGYVVTVRFNDGSTVIVNF